MLPGDNRIRDRLLAVIAGILVVAALRWSYPITMPLAAAAFVVAAAWPIKPRLERLLPAGLSYASTVLALLLAMAGLFAAIYFSVAQVVQVLAQRQEKFRELYGAYADWARAHGLRVFGGDDGYARLLALAQAVLAEIYDVLAYLGLVAVLVLLGLPEVPALRRWLREALRGEERRATLEAVERIAAMFRSYVGVMALTSLATGLACAGWALAIGLDLALTWGVLNCLLNVIPIFGNILGIIPPTLYAVVQFDGWTMPLVTFLGFAAIQIAVSYFVEPWAQGRSLSLPPVVVVVALTFWGWVWGGAGALLSVPLTAAIVIVCRHFPATAWIARLLAGAPGEAAGRGDAVARPTGGGEAGAERP